MTFTDKPNELQRNLDEESLLHRMIKQIRRSLDLQEILRELHKKDNPIIMLV
ncbi:MAG: hypothetical protein WCO29_15890 [Nostocales cyanobacterium ELA583]|jgi:hypothetical protein